MSVRLPEPELIVDRSAQPFLSDKVEATVNGLLDMVKKEARRSATPIAKIEIRGWTDPEYGGHQVIVRLWVDETREASLDFWGRLTAPFEAWVDSLPQRQAEIAMEQIAIEVEGMRDEPAV